MVEYSVNIKQLKELSDNRQYPKLFDRMMDKIRLQSLTEFNRDGCLCECCLANECTRNKKVFIE
jgi:hypothetical protein